MFGFLSRWFGNASERKLYAYRSRLPQIHAAQAALKELDDQGLRDASGQLRAYLAKELGPLREELEQIRQQAREGGQDLGSQARLYDREEKLARQIYAREQVLLQEILPQAFAIIRETAYRFSVKPRLEVVATPFDEALAGHHAHITIENGKAYWARSWKVRDEILAWNIVHYDVQLIGGMVLHEGKIAEMFTGEGKTLTATPPAFLNALTGHGVHVVTVNDHLSARDLEWMAPLYQFHLLTVDCIDLHAPYSADRKAAYQADITLGTNSEFGFDYLRDNMVTSAEEKVQRGLYYAIIDEVDSVLIDDARTPMIMSVRAPHNDHKEYALLKPYIAALYEEQKKLVAAWLREAREHLKAGQQEEAGLALLRIYRSLPKYQPFIDLLSEAGMKQLLSATEDHYMQDNAALMPEADEPLYFVTHHSKKAVELGEKGLELLARKKNDPTFFVLPDLGSDLATIDERTDLSTEEKNEEKASITEAYYQRSIRVHATQQLLKAYVLYQQGVDYEVIGGKVKLVDEKTGRIQHGKRYSEGLHQALEAREGVKIQAPTQIYASITSQNFFRMYKKLAGMTGTAVTEEKEFYDIYKLEVVAIPTHFPMIRQDLPDKVFKKREYKLKAIREDVRQLLAQGRPVLVQTPSVESSEEMRKLLGLPPSQVLNARNHRLESLIVAQAGQEGRATIITPMGGRGTDIKLSPAARAAGGLAVIVSEKGASRRVDRQIFGRAGRQGDPGTAQAYVSLEDALLVHFRHHWVGKNMDKLIFEEGQEVVEDPYISKMLPEEAQLQKERNDFNDRKRTVEYDDVLNMQRSVIYKKRDHALSGERLPFDVMYMLYEVIESVVNRSKQHDDADMFRALLTKIFAYNPPINKQAFRQAAPDRLVSQLFQALQAHYEQHKQTLKEGMEAFLQPFYKEAPDHAWIQVPFGVAGKKEIEVELHVQSCQQSEHYILYTFQRSIVLHFIDEYWMHHLQEMEMLREAVQNVVYAQKDPLLTYKFEGLALFDHMRLRLAEDCLTALLQARPLYSRAQPLSKHTPGRRAEEVRGAAEAAFPEQQPGAEEHSPPPKGTPIRAGKVANRNEKVTVRYEDGTLRENVKYKAVAQDLMDGKCALVGGDTAAAA